MILREVALIGTASPRPTPATAVLIPTTWPRESARAPPELPGLRAASVWITSSTIRVAVRVRTGSARPSPLTMPAVTLPAIPRGLPTATTRLPIRRSSTSRKTGGSTIGWSARTTARSASGSRPMTSKRALLPSANVASPLSALPTTWALVSRCPSELSTTADPDASPQERRGLIRMAATRGNSASATAVTTREYASNASCSVGSMAPLRPATDNAITGRGVPSPRVRRVDVPAQTQHPGRLVRRPVKSRVRAPVPRRWPGALWNQVQRRASHECHLSGTCRRDARLKPEPLDVAGEVGSGDSALRRLVLLVDRVHSDEHRCVLRDSHHWPLPARHLRIQHRRPALVVAGLVLRLRCPGNGPLPAVHPGRGARLPGALERGLSRAPVARLGPGQVVAVGASALRHRRPVPLRRRVRPRAKHHPPFHVGRPGVDRDPRVLRGGGAPVHRQVSPRHVRPGARPESLGPTGRGVRGADDRRLPTVPAGLGRQRPGHRAALGG